MQSQKAVPAYLKCQVVIAFWLCTAVYPTDTWPDATLLVSCDLECLDCFIKQRLPIDPIR